MLALTRANERLGRAISASFGFGLAELNALIHIAEVGRLTPTEIGRRLDLPRPTVTALLDRLERSGLALRSPDSVDRRKVYLALTEAGEAAIRWTHAQWRNAFLLAGVEEIPRAIGDLAGLTQSILDQASALQRDPKTWRDWLGVSDASKPPSGGAPTHP